MPARAIFCILAVLWPCRTGLAEGQRLLRLLDFEERQRGNAEELPMHWVKVEGPGMPHYVNARLSRDAARSGEFSFRFDLNGGSLVYRYPHGRVPMLHGARYRAQVHARTSDLPNARARLVAYASDDDGRPVPATRQESSLFASAPGASEWTALSVDVEAADPRAAWLVVELQLLQPAAYASSALGGRAIHRQDIHGSAWFDDLSIAQVPRMALLSDRPGNLFRRSDPLVLQAEVQDRHTRDLRPSLSVRDADGAVCWQQTGGLSLDGSAESARHRLSIALPDHLPAGWYEASLELFSDGTFVDRATLAFIRLPDDLTDVPADPRFAARATHLAPASWSALPEVLAAAGFGAVKLAVWSREADLGELSTLELARLLRRLRERDVHWIAVLAGLPPSLPPEVAGGDWSALAGAPTSAWQPALAYLLARHANHLRAWQLGDDMPAPEPQALLAAYDAVRGEFERLMDLPVLATPWPLWREPTGGAAHRALHVPGDVLPQHLPLYLAEPLAAGAGTSLVLTPLDAARWDRRLRLRDYAQRVVYALAGGARRLDLPLGMAFEPDGRGGLAPRPEELLLVTRTLILLLGGAEYRGNVPLDVDAEAMLFDRAGRGTLVLWDRRGAASRTLAVDLGPDAVAVDLWGNVRPLLRSPNDRDAGQLRVEVGAMPLFLVGVDVRLARLRESLRLDNGLLESSFRPQARVLSLVNAFDTAISGTLRLEPPEGWTLNPPTVNFTLNPGERLDREIAIEIPFNASAGDAVIAADVSLNAERAFRFTQPLAIRLGLSDVGLQTSAARDGADLVVQQVITNYGQAPLNYSAFAQYPGLARQERLVTDLAPGHSAVKRYRFSPAPPGARVRSGLKELDGPRLLNEEIEVP